jgi:septation ring formation regulator EzrA
MENHAEIKDKCDGLDSRMDEIAADIRDLPFDYKIVEKYSHIDEEIQQIYEWYEEKKSILLEYLKEKEIIENKLKELEMHSKHLNNSVQNLKSQAFSHVQHGVSYSQSQGNQHL